MIKSLQTSALLGLIVFLGTAAAGARTGLASLQHVPVVLNMTGGHFEVTPGYGGDNMILFGFSSTGQSFVLTATGDFFGVEPAISPPNIHPHFRSSGMDLPYNSISLSIGGYDIPLLEDHTPGVPHAAVRIDGTPVPLPRPDHPISNSFQVPVVAPITYEIEFDLYDADNITAFQPDGSIMGDPDYLLSATGVGIAELMVSGSYFPEFDHYLYVTSIPAEYSLAPSNSVIPEHDSFAVWSLLSLSALGVICRRMRPV
jgi:hypothetical protein